MEERAILYVMEHYHVSRDTVCEFYQDEVEALIRIWTHLDSVDV